MTYVIDPDGERVLVSPYVDPDHMSQPFSEWFGSPDGGVSLIGGRTVSYAELYASQLWVGTCVDRMLTWSVLVPLKTYRRVGPDGERQRVRPGEHPLADAIESPWPGAGPVQLVQHLLGPKLVHGNGLSRVESGAGDTLRFAIKDWRSMRPVRENPTARWPGPIVGWLERDVFGEEHGIPLDEILHISHWSPLGPLGVSPLRMLGVTLQLEDAAQRWARSTLARSFRPSGVVEITEDYLKLDETDQQKLYDATAKRLRSLYGGADQAGEPPIFPPGVSWKDAAPSTAVEVRLLEQRRVNREEAAAVYQIPAPMVGILDKACLPADALIDTERGPVPAAEVRPGDRVFALVDGKLKLSEVSWSRQTGVEPIVTVRTTNRTLRCTDNHPLLVARRHKANRSKRTAGRWAHEWVAAGDLQVGDLIVTAEKLPDYGTRSCPTRDDLTVGFAEFCGLLLGDGNVKYDASGSPSGIGIARAATARYMDHYRQVMRDEFQRLQTGGTGGRELRARKPITLTEQDRQTRFSSRLAAEEMVKLGLAGTARTKRVPEWVGALVPDLRAAFIRGFADADGSVDKRGHLSFHSANETLLRQIRDLCIGLGVPVCNVQSSRSWVTLPDGNTIFSVMWSFKAADPVANTTIIGSHDPVDQERMEAGKPWGRKQYAYRYRGSDGPPAAEGCGHARVRSVERGEISIPVYDIEVPDGHNFVVDGVVTHNTYSNISTLRQVAYTDGLAPPLVTIESVINARVCRELLGQPDLFVEFDFSGVLRGDKLREIQAIREAIATSVLTPNEGRDLQGKKRSDDPAADLLYGNQNMRSLRSLGQDSQPDKPKP